MGYVSGHIVQDLARHRRQRVFLRQRPRRRPAGNRRRFGVSGTDKFAGLSWSPSRSGAPVLDGALTWVECSVEAGDH
jgi:flavin reductase (DIM6/NTAB) family NADH-FMN oxidoreductase RutF